MQKNRIAYCEFQNGQLLRNSYRSLIDGIGSFLKSWHLMQTLPGLPQLHGLRLGDSRWIHRVHGLLAVLGRV